MFWKKSIAVVALSAMLAMSYVVFAIGAVSPEEVAKLGGTELTAFGAERAGNKDGTIPEYTGGLTTPPKNYKKGSGIRPDPFAGETPLFNINASNMGDYADKLTEGTKALMKKYSSFSINVYKTHRTVAYPKVVLDDTKKNAVNVKLLAGGNSISGAHAMIPFPIPKNGYEVMWNHLTRYEGLPSESVATAWNIDSNGKRVLVAKGVFWQDYPYYENRKNDEAMYFRLRCDWTGPPRLAGLVVVLKDPLNMADRGRVAYQYLPGQRRVKLAPELAFDTPNPSSAGVMTYDDTFVFNGSLERYNWKLIGKKEVFVPYNAYTAVYIAKADDLFKQKHLNPDLVRWELHRVWVVEATLKPNKRHIYHKRTFYVDEDSWAALTAENYDARGQMYKVAFSHQSPHYDMPAPASVFQAFYDLVGSNYGINPWYGDGGYLKGIPQLSDNFWSFQSLAGRGVR